ncbi:ATP-binding protein [Haloechinothrix halophila]|uniref:ATP-binding protein n=1 Tax=Haloechinothrix halophila TaxID=1069073 RepID=UPI0003FC5952|nr:hypothetical protein [Haloechinothrix halophila]
MSVLVLQRLPLAAFPYPRWLAEYDGEVVVLAAAAAMDGVAPARGYPVLETFTDFDHPRVLRRAREEIAARSITHVIAHHEADVGRAAALREEFGLAGAYPADVVPFRDKLIMKARAMRAGIEVAPHSVPRSSAEAVRFATAHGFPVVVKDRAGFSSIGLRIVRDRAELAGIEFGDVLLEAFVPGRMCHVDGVVAAGKTALAWPSQYQYDLASFGSDTGARVDVTLDADDPLTGRLLEFTDRTLAALTGDGTSRLRDYAFHAEVFHTPDDRLVLCEIACRPAGAKVRDVLRSLFDADPAEYATRAQLGLPLPALEQAMLAGELPRPRAMGGQVLTMKRPGLVRSLPARPAEDWVQRFWVYAEPGQLIPPAAGSSDFLTAAVATAPTRAECERRLRDLGARIVAETDIVDETDIVAETDTLEAASC